MTNNAAAGEERTVQIRNKFGLHARPAAEFVKMASRFNAEVMVRKQDLEVNGKSIMGMMMLAAECGAEIVIRASGDDAKNAVEELATLVNNRFGED
ncbi:MAG TPA: HPr family phosphocarrier protein [Longimicrobiales bacterium]|nr:HPr family phosphocarrier protein [Longimicrobiales bacterium]